MLVGWVFFPAVNTERRIAELTASIKQETVFWVHLIHAASHHHPNAALPVLLLPAFHLVVVMQAHFVKSKEPSPNSYPCSSKTGW